MCELFIKDRDNDDDALMQSTIIHLIKNKSGNLTVNWAFWNVCLLLLFIDYAKAFDKINYRKLFLKLLDDNVSCIIVSLVAYLYAPSPHVLLYKFGRLVALGQNVLAQITLGELVPLGMWAWVIH